MSTARRFDSARFERTESKGLSPPGSIGTFLDRQPPCNVKTEQCLLGSIFLKPDVCDETALILRARISTMKFTNASIARLWRCTMQAGRWTRSYSRSA